MLISVVGKFLNFIRKKDPQIRFVDIDHSQYKIWNDSNYTVFGGL